MIDAHLLMPIGMLCVFAGYVLGCWHAQRDL